MIAPAVVTACLPPACPLPAEATGSGTTTLCWPQSGQLRALTRWLPSALLTNAFAGNAVRAAAGDVRGTMRLRPRPDGALGAAG